MDALTSLGIDWHLIVTQIFGFLIFAWIFVKLVSKPVLNILDQRQGDIKSTYDQLDADRDAMERTRKEYEQRLADIENHARERIQQAVKEAQELRASIIAEAQQQAQNTIENGRAELDRERTRTFVEMRQQVADLAIQAAEKVIGESMDDARQRKLVDDFIAGVGAAPLRAGRNGADGGGRVSAPGGAV